MEGINGKWYVSLPPAEIQDGIKDSKSCTHCTTGAPVAAYCIEPQAIRPFRPFLDSALEHGKHC